MNTWFQFKEFIIRQDKTAMKVTTDACLFGAVVADKIIKKEIDPAHILDVGCGTGLLSLMLAQVSDADLVAVEIETNAYVQAKENFSENKKDHRITACHSSIESFETERKFDLIICNPPFFDNDLKSPSAERNLAMHTNSLSFEALCRSMKKLLQENGTAAMLLAYNTNEKFSKVLNDNGLFVNERIHIRHRTGSAFIRTIIICGAIHKQIIEKHITIKNDSDVYTREFFILLKPYYLNF